jgi:hypothetical protein
MPPEVARPAKNSLALSTDRWASVARAQGTGRTLDKPEHGWGPASAMFGARALKVSVYCCIRQICANRALPVGKIANNYRDLKYAGKLSQSCPIDFSIH